MFNLKMIFKLNGLIMIKKNYSTKQRDYLIDFFKSNANGCFTIEEILRNAASDGIKIGKTTVYRNLERLAGDGIILKYNISSGGGACFRYLTDRAGDAAHCHLYCIGCGSVTHLDCGHIGKLGEHIRSEHKFDFDKSRTVFYGRCHKCADSDGANRGK
jgi:Fur family ferric uptake transcriptional regulator